MELWGRIQYNKYCKEEEIVEKYYSNLGEEVQDIRRTITITDHYNKIF